MRQHECACVCVCVCVCARARVCVCVCVCVWLTCRELMRKVCAAYIVTSCKSPDLGKIRPKNINSCHPEKLGHMIPYPWHFNEGPSNIFFLYINDDWFHVIQGKTQKFHVICHKEAKTPTHTYPHLHTQYKILHSSKYTYNLWKRHYFKAVICKEHSRPRRRRSRHAGPSAIPTLCTCDLCLTNSHWSHRLPPVNVIPSMSFTH
jgi:hypothetical protein